MKKSKPIFILIPIYVSFLLIFFLIGVFGNKAITLISESRSPVFERTFVIDAGHGGIDGGATSVSGVLESHINLSIAQKLNDIMHLLGMPTSMIRTEDISVYTEGNTIAQKKISDLKHRVNLVNNTPGAVLLSIHQNHFADPKYYGAQIFYNAVPEGRELAEKMQNAFKKMTNTNRQIKQASGVYLLQHVNRPAILIECGFISNSQDETKLLNNSYQIKICSIIACSCSLYYNSTVA